MDKEARGKEEGRGTVSGSERVRALTTLCAERHLDNIRIKSVT